MATITLKLTTPQGYPMDLTLDPTTDGDEVKALLDRADKLAGWLTGRGWGFADAQPALPSPRELAAGPTFCGYPCSPTVDDAGLPTWILVGERQAMRRERQGDRWWSVKEADGSYTQVLRIPKGEKPPQVVGLPAAQ